MGSKAVVFDNTTPEIVFDVRAVFNRANPVFPVIGIGEAAARPAQYRYVQLFKSIYDIFTVSVDIWNV